MSHKNRGWQPQNTQKSDVIVDKISAVVLKQNEVLIIHSEKELTQIQKDKLVKDFVKGFVPVAEGDQPRVAFVVGPFKVGKVPDTSTRPITPERSGG